MSITSLLFVCFVLVAFVGYYLIPQKYQWIWLLIFSYIYYLSTGFKTVIYLLSVTLSTYFCGRLIQKNNEGSKGKNQNRWILIFALLFNFGILAYLKYTNFVLFNIMRIFHTEIPLKELVLPLGISFYTFQSMGYLLDVYWKKEKAETNPFRFALFVSFFPQILQGPISRFSDLGKQLFTPHKANTELFQRALLFILFGLFKKLVLADTIAPFVDYIFSNYQELSGPYMILGVLGYSAQLYGDFSGGMNVVEGVAMLFGICLTPNFKQPFFATSITDFWHRWHITLGTWMKDYVFYPVSLSKWMSKLSRFLKKHLGKKLGRSLPICIANLIVFFVVGIWHGAEWRYIIYGLYNGLIIGVSGLLADRYRKIKKQLSIKDSQRGWHLFQIFRTFLLVNISWFFDRAPSVSQAFSMIRKTVTEFTLLSPAHISQTFSSISRVSMRCGIIGLSILLIFMVSFLEENGIKPFERFLKLPSYIKVFIYLSLLLLLPLLGQVPTVQGGFIYANF
ncbi:MAG TPA: MBOAT family O-acyltransferase [Lachnospiraceae bacterium]